MTRDLRAFMRGQFVRGAKLESAAVDIEHDGPLAAQARRPDVQLQHVFALPAVIPVLDECLLIAGPVVQSLRAICTINKSRILILPRHRRLCRQPAILAARVLSVRNALEGKHASIQVPANFSILRVGNSTARSGTSSRLLLVHSGLNAV